VNTGARLPIFTVAPAKAAPPSKFVTVPETVAGEGLGEGEGDGPPPPPPQQGGPGIEPPPPPQPTRAAMPKATPPENINLRTEYFMAISI